MTYLLKNDTLTAVIDYHGAEIKSVVKNGADYMWNGDAKYWGRTSPVLFPFVGSVKGGVYRDGGREYPMGQHGFARDCDFELAEETGDSVTFDLRSGADTLEKYPYEFVLKITYTLSGSRLSVKWTVENPSDREMYFSIGAHPAFMCPIDESAQSDYKLRFDTDTDISYRLLSGGLLDKSREYTLKTSDGYADITEGMFDRDALIVEGRQARRISLCRPDGREYVTVETDAPLFGLWSPAGKNAPFICIEPWYGRCDAADFDGELKEREYSNTLSGGGVFTAEYTMEFI